MSPSKPNRPFKIRMALSKDFQASVMAICANPQPSQVIRISKLAVGDTRQGFEVHYGDM
jgi:hypothetical protein